jgi:hypothetical protein
MSMPELLPTMARSRLVAHLVLGLLFVSLALTGGNTRGQASSPITVPDVVGLTVPEAAAVLHRAGLKLGPQTSVYRLDQAHNTVIGQTPPADASAEPLSEVGIEVVIQTNIEIVYDNNDITVINLTGTTLNGGRMRFEAIDSGLPSPPAFSFNEVADLRVSVDDDQCLQFWSISEGMGQPADGCARGLDGWFASILTERHFWTRASEAATFRFWYGDQPVGDCPTMRDLRGKQRCPMRLALDPDEGDTAEYLYFVYSADQLIVKNASARRWMAVDGVTFGGIDLGDFARIPRETFVGSERRLAPGECILLTAASISTGEPIQDDLSVECFVIARGELSDVDLFWRRGFALGDAASCPPPPATNAARSICLVPR